MTGYKSKKAAAQAKLEGPIHVVCQCDKCKAQPAQKPLTDAEMETTFIECGGKWTGDYWKIEDADFHPFLRTIKSPKRPWVGLTNDDIFAVVKDLYSTDESAFISRIDDIATARAIEAALKNKNT